MTIETKNLSATLYGAGDLRMKKRIIVDSLSIEVQVNVRATGICGSDLHYYASGRMGSRVLEASQSMILGHESSGVVTKIGSGVTRVAVGDRVVIEPGKACHVCPRCKEGRYNLCSKMAFASSLIRGPNDGSLREYVCYPEHLCHPMPETMTFEQGALIEPLSVAVHAVSRTPLTKGSNAVVIGAGAVGLLVSAVAYAEGATQCTILDINSDRLAFAEKYLPGIRTIQLDMKKEPDSVQSPLDWAADQVPLLGIDRDTVDVVYECTGVETSVALAVHLSRPGGTAMLIGMGKGRCVIPTELVTMQEINLLGTFRYCHSHAKAIELVNQGKVSTEGLVTHRFALKNAADAFAMAKSAQKGVIKVQIGDF
ncbi:GroES-like protein [Backusella circina FSU 941]|nr:GroES-like protein [Backusella circina FSU 941]